MKGDKMKGVNKFKITNEVAGILLADGAITALVENRVFPLNAPLDTKGDFIIYMRDEYSIKRGQMRIASQECRVYINAVSTNYNRSQELASLIFTALDGIFSDPDMEIRLEDSTEDYTDGKYIQVLLFSIK